eukprot:1459170-Amphidinium_carterae.1
MWSTLRSRISACTGGSTAASSVDVPSKESASSVRYLVLAVLLSTLLARGAAAMVVQAIQGQGTQGKGS